MDSILRMPGGCFEQTSSSTYPNVLALDYMKRTKKLTPEIHAKAEGYIANGYQRLLTFEVPGGGFSWFGQAPANKILTAYGLMEFNDMSKVSDVDPATHRAHPRLARPPAAARRQLEARHLLSSTKAQPTATTPTSSASRPTSHGRSSNTGYQGPAVEKAKHLHRVPLRVRSPTPTRWPSSPTSRPTTAKDRDFTRQSMQALIDARTEKDDQVFWTVEETGVYSTGASAAIETTGLATQALLKWGQATETVRKALNFISSKKEASGNWGTTQATIMALRAAAPRLSKSSASDVRGTVEVMLNGKLVETAQANPREQRPAPPVRLQRHRRAASQHLSQLKFEGTGGLAYQVVGRYFTPWEEQPADEPLSIDVAYDRTHLAQNDIATATATIRNNLPKTANMVMVDLGIPPGFDLLSEDLQAFQEKTASAKPAVSKNSASPRPRRSSTSTRSLRSKPSPSIVRLRAKYPIRARTFQSRVYEYYDPDVNSTTSPVRIEVNEH